MPALPGSRSMVAMAALVLSGTFNCSLLFVSNRMLHEGHSVAGIMVARRAVSASLRLGRRGVDVVAAKRSLAAFFMGRSRLRRTRVMSAGLARLQRFRDHSSD